LTEITIPERITEIPEDAFTHCEELTTVVISEGVESIGEAAFSNCESLTEITIPKSVTSIGDDAFDSCPLETIYVPAGKVEYFKGLLPEDLHDKIVEME
jgi:hypothetical protein